MRRLGPTITAAVLLAAASAGAQPAGPAGIAPDRSRARAARVLEELRQRGCDRLTEGPAGQACVDAVLAAVYPPGFTKRPDDGSPEPAH